MPASTAEKTIILVTGANAGLGYELVSQLLSASPNNHILLGSRSVTKGKAAVEALQSAHQSSTSTVELLPLDVSSPQSIEEALQKVQEKHDHLDAIVNNAAIAFPTGSLSEQMSSCFQTNATGPLLIVEAFIPLLRKSSNTPRILNVSSGAGSITRRLDQNSLMYQTKAPQYAASKAALNMITACQTAWYGEEGFKVFSFCPGFTVSNISGMNTAENGAKPTSEGVKPMLEILAGKRDEEAGGFLHEKGQYPW